MFRLVGGFTARRPWLIVAAWLALALALAGVAPSWEAHAQDDSGDMFPEDVREVWEQVRDNERARMRVVSDYIASMTDRYALELYSRLFEPASSAYRPW